MPLTTASGPGSWGGGFLYSSNQSCPWGSAQLATLHPRGQLCPRLTTKPWGIA